MAGQRGQKELVKIERPRFLAPFEEIEHWFDEAWRRPFSLFTPRWHGGLSEEFETVLPAVDIYEEGNSIVLKADLPGLEKEDVDIHIADNILTVSGERKKEEKFEKGDYFRYERTHGSFYRRFELPTGIDVNKVKAHMENGVLELKLPRAEDATERSRKISIS